MYISIFEFEIAKNKIFGDAFSFSKKGIALSVSTLVNMNIYKK